MVPALAQSFRIEQILAILLDDGRRKRFDGHLMVLTKAEAVLEVVDVLLFVDLDGLIVHKANRRILHSWLRCKNFRNVRLIFGHFKVFVLLGVLFHALQAEKRATAQKALSVVRLMPADGKAVIAAIPIGTPHQLAKVIYTLIIHLTIPQFRLERFITLPGHKRYPTRLRWDKLKRVHLSLNSLAILATH